MGSEVRAPLSGLYAVTPDTADTADLLRRLEQALQGGLALVQYRNKLAGPALKRQQAAALLTLCRNYGVPLIINDDLNLALALDADGVHLGREDAPAGGLAAARAALGPTRLLGVSCYNEFERAVEAQAAGADYVAFGALFPSSTKPGAQAASLDLFRRGREELVISLCGIGGITLDNAPAAIQAGAQFLAVISDLFDAPDIEARAAAYSRLF